MASYTLSSSILFINKQRLEHPNRVPDIGNGVYLCGSLLERDLRALKGNGVFLEQLLLSQNILLVLLFGLELLLLDFGGVKMYFSG
jgi:hypothetical protein